MKKSLLIFAALIGFAISANAQIQCVIQGAGDNSTVTVQSCYLSEDNKSVIVNVINDSKDIAANVTVSVEVTYVCNGGTKKKPYQGTGLSIAGNNAEIKIPIDTIFSDGSCYVASSVEAKTISGKKCN